MFTDGTLGDHLPFTALGRALAGRGHAVTLAAGAEMLPHLDTAGLQTFPLAGLNSGPENARRHARAWNAWGEAQNSPPANEPPRPEALAEFVEQCRQLARLCQEHDLFCATTIRPHGLIAARASGALWASISLNSAHFWQPGDPQARQWLEDGRRREYPAVRNLAVYTWGQLGVQVPPPPFTPGWLFAPLLLLAASPFFTQPDPNQLQPQCRLALTGFWRTEISGGEGWQPGEALRRFCQPDAQGRRPLALAFSSQPLEEPERILALHARTARLLGRRLLVQRGWAGFAPEMLPPEADPADFLFTDFLPHDWLFANVDGAIQHGGIGSIASALRQGCPLLVEPFGNDQLENARQVARLGAGAGRHPFESTPEELAQALDEFVLAPAARQRAAALGEKLRQEDGLETACSYLEIYLRRSALPGPRLWSRPSMDLPNPEAYSSGTIPHVLHQTWKDANLPPALAAWQQTWLEHNPGWQLHLWTDLDNRELIRTHYPWFLPIYDGYPHPIQRADAVRYFILHHYGGVYADLDFECLRPLEPLLAGKQLIFGLEPDEHLSHDYLRQHNLQQLICNAWMASIPGHPFWEHLFKALLASHRLAGALPSTGPFMLTHACLSYPEQQSITLEPASVLYPIHSAEKWDELPESRQQAIRQAAFAVHHWLGSYYRSDLERQRFLVPLTLLDEGQALGSWLALIPEYLARFNRQAPLPRVTAMLVTGRRPALARRAVENFRRQTYPNKELLALDDGPDDGLAEWIAGLGDPQIRCVRLPAEGRSLGALRNLAVELASGEFVAQWDDDDLSDPLRLEAQLAVMHVLQAQACFLERHLIWWPGQRRLAVSTRRIWESSFVCRKDCLPRYPELRQGEDTPVIEQLARQGRSVLLDAPTLYTYVFHGANTFEQAHWDAHWRAASESYEGSLYDARLAELQNRLGLDLDSEIGLEQSAQPALSPAKPAPAAGQPATTARPTAAGALPRVLILSPVKNAAAYLPRFFENLETLSYPHDRIALAFLESDSSDDTAAQIEKRLPALRGEFARAELFQRSFGFQMKTERWATGEQFQRRAVLARSRNLLLSLALGDENWVLWLDVDVARWPADIIERLLAAGKEIVTPNCLALGTEEPFDLNSYKLAPGAEKLDWRPYIVDGILQPPPGFGRLYLQDLRPFNAVELDGVGATMLLVRADLHREGLVFPPYSYRMLIETEGLAAMAKDMGYRCWGLPGVVIYHPQA